MSRAPGSVLVLGVGNILWADEGFGVRCAEVFADAYETPPGVDIVDGGTQGLALVNSLAEAERILLFDAVDADKAPGTLVVARGPDVPRFVAGKKVSLHQTSMMEVLALAEFMAEAPPPAITLIGCQPKELEDYGGGLTREAAAQVAPAAAQAAAELQGWGVTLKARCSAAAPLAPAEVAWRAYEDGRPNPHEACRVGDERVLVRAARQGR